MSNNPDAMADWTEPTTQPSVPPDDHYAAAKDLDTLTVVVAVVSAILFLLVLLLAAAVFYFWKKTKDNSDIAQQLKILQSDMNNVRRDVATLQGREMVKAGMVTRGESVFLSPPSLAPLPRPEQPDEPPQLPQQAPQQPQSPSPQPQPPSPQPQPPSPQPQPPALDHPQTPPIYPGLPPLDEPQPPTPHQPPPPPLTPHPPYPPSPEQPKPPPIAPKPKPKPPSTSSSSPSSPLTTNIVPRYSMAFLQQAVDVFESNIAGHAAMPEIFMAAQNYYDHDTHVQTVRKSMVTTVKSERMQSVAVENIKVVPLYKKGYEVVDRERPSDAIAEGKRPKSIFIPPDTDMEIGSLDISELSKPPQSMSGMFSTELIGPAGGTVEIYGVSLEFPAGSLKEKQNIRLGIVWEASHQPRMDRKTALLSPVVSCEPHGLKLLKPVKLVMPHCAGTTDEETDVNTAWKFTIMKSETPLEGRAHWTGATLDDYDMREIDKTHLSLTVTHFSLFTLIGQCLGIRATKVVRLVAFAPPLNPPDFFKITVYCVHDYKDKMLHDEMDEQKAKRLGVQKPLMVRNTEEDIRVLLDAIPEGWELKGPAEEDLDFRLVWHGVGENCEFILKPIGEQSEIICRTVGYQIGQEKKKQVIKIAQRKQIEFRQQPEADAPNLVFPSVLRDTIIKLLDPPIIGESDWHQLAEKLDMRWEDIRYFENQGGPTFLLLLECEKRGWTLERFKKVMENIDRYDVADEVQTFLDNNKPPSHTSSGRNPRKRPMEEQSGDRNSDVSIEVTSLEEETSPKVRIRFDSEDAPEDTTF